ncbi:MAG: hypothetical protein CMB97_05575 [Flavobacteriaceae bacterium]|nr:hypothetical protein [Flavobacteriaceae bacterium]|tara:strand:- start:346 stop:999 length:654 start_codon:yes stop_codon:yes gene_type:complete
MEGDKKGIIRPLKNTEFRVKSNSFEGTIIIPDISGFTSFVNSMDFSLGKEITIELLQVIIDQNILNLTISEIEGDAILFYKKSTLTLQQVKKQYEQMLSAFSDKVNTLSLQYGFEIKLSLKLVAHYGEISTYTIGGFEKLYGKPVIEAHQLLKNPIKSNSYFLITEDFFNATSQTVNKTHYSGSKLCEVYGSLKNIGYIFFDYEADRDNPSINGYLR